MEMIPFTRVTFINLDPEKSLYVESTMMEIFSEIEECQKYSYYCILILMTSLRFSKSIK